MATKRPELKVEKREILGKKVKKLRRKGLLPANIYGKGLESVSVQLGMKDFETIYKQVGETGLIDVSVDGQLRPVLIHNVQFDFETHNPLHADFYQVNLKEKVKTTVGVVTVGEPKAVTEKVGLLLQPLTEVEIEALPADLPEKIEINVEKLATVDEQITVAELKVPSAVTILTDPSQVVVKISELVSKEAEALAQQEAAAAEEAKAESEEGTTTEVPTTEPETSAEAPQEKTEEVS